MLHCLHVSCWTCLQVQQCPACLGCAKASWVCLTKCCSQAPYVATSRCPSTHLKGPHPYSCLLSAARRQRRLPDAPEPWCASCSLGAGAWQLRVPCRLLAVMNPLE